MKTPKPIGSGKDAATLDLMAARLFLLAARYEPTDPSLAGDLRALARLGMGVDPCPEYMRDLQRTHRTWARLRRKGAV